MTFAAIGCALIAIGTPAMNVVSSGIFGTDDYLIAWAKRLLAKSTGFA
jgi:hypothetical protein